MSLKIKLLHLRTRNLFNYTNMKHKKLIAVIVFLFLGLGGLQAQDAIPASGGDVIASDGSTSYTVGRLIFGTYTGSDGSLSHGLQQPYEIYITTGIEDKSINLDLSVYPNPTISSLTLKTESTDDIKYQLFNLQGELLEDKIVNENNTTIRMEELAHSIYFLKVIKNEQIVKTFKIIKN